MVVTEPASGEKVTQTPSRAPRGTRTPRNGSGEESGNGARYFLGKSGANGNLPALEKELTSEGEAMVEALRLGVTFYRVQEFRAIPDYSGKNPQLRREPVSGK